MADSILDRFDRAILAILQEDNTTPLRRIGELVHLSAAAVQRRIRRLEQTGVIQANTAQLDPARLGRAITLIVEISVESERLDLLDATQARLAAAPEIQQCYYVTGESDFVLIVTVRTMAEYQALTRRLFFADGNVKSFRTHVVMDRIKTGTRIPVD
ncbi:MAG TPA: Lrp/AsnC family transcriptional regulator [Geminicoccus sp.]|uniref:Lrp/AsnC family transcriptional regulator n=1 Tax=Geminicoccus sp. TaxID=2024832 RepID=UPI002CA7217F|nr:Lrp/AsnC family transcriptional regulator [Geminicoccus sp.]HWL69972.1 Lrp/AsnC family transcriptional regulator [Geminicoccus sp.]